MTVTCSYFEFITAVKRPEVEGEYWLLSGAKNKDEFKSISSVPSYFKTGEKIVLTFKICGCETL
jgi:hypothetical protein